VVFYSNEQSRKGRELRANPTAAALFGWHQVSRQVRVSGPVERKRLVNRPQIRGSERNCPFDAPSRALAVDTVVCLNVLEHIEQDTATLSDLFYVLRPGGRIVLIVPALQALYGSLDEHLHHVRRYEKAELEEKVRNAGFVLEDVRFLNRPGIVGWWVNGRLLRRRVLPAGQLAAFKLLLPLLKREEANPPSIGMSLLAIGRKPA